MAITIALEPAGQDDVRALVAELNAHLLTLTPPEFCSHLTVEQMAGPQTSLFIARDSGVAVGMGALHRHAPDLAEVKRMYTRPAWQGHGVGGMILERIEQLAAQEAITHLVLETGDRHPAAWRVYERAGFNRCGPVLDYPDSKWSVFYEKRLASEGRAA